MKTLPVPIEDELDAALGDLCAYQGREKAELVVGLLRTYVESEGGVLTRPDHCTPEQGEERLPAGVDLAAASQARREAEALLRTADDTSFEDGVESEFARATVSLVEAYGRAGVHALGNLIVRERVNVHVAAEALRWLGRMEHHPTREERLQLLEKALLATSPYVRDGAALGLVFLNDRRSIAWLRAAREHESSPGLRRNLNLAIAELETTARCP